MVFRDIDKKALIDNAATVSSKITIVGTDITFTEDDFISEWDYEDYRYVPENGFIGQFVERILDGKLKDLPTDINLENKEINLQIGINNGITGETTYYDYGNFIVTKTGEQDTTGISTFESADYTKKFNAEYVDSLTYPCLALELANSACEQAGVELATSGYTYCYAVPKEGLVAGTYRFLIDNTSYEFVISENLKFYDSIMYIVDENRMVLKRVNEDFSITRTNLDYNLVSSSTSTELKVRKTGYYDFINNDFVIENNQFESTDTLREVIKSVAKLAYTWVRVGTDNKVYLDFKKKTSSSYGLTINGKSLQDGTPTPTAPIEIKNVEGVTNEFNINLVPNVGVITNNGDGTLTFANNTNTVGYAYSETTLSTLMPNVKVGETYKLLFKSTFTRSTFYNTNIYLSGSDIYLTSGNTFVLTQQMLDSKVVFYGGYNEISTISDFIITKDLNCDSYVPYGRWLEVKSIGKNLCNGINQNYYLNTASNSVGKNTGDTGLAIPINGATKMTISTNVTQERYRVACVNELPTTSTGIGAYKGKNKDNTSSSVTIDTTNYKYLIVNATDLTKIQVEEGSTNTEIEDYKEITALVNMNKVNLKDDNNILNGTYMGVSGNIGEVTGNTMLYVEIEENTTYTIQKIQSNRFRVGTYNSLDIVGKTLNNRKVDDTLTKYTFTNTTDKYLFFQYISGDTNTEEIYNSIKIYEGLEIDDYYSFKENDTFENGKHTQTRTKIILDGSENWFISALNGHNIFQLNDIINCKQDSEYTKYCLCDRYRSISLMGMKNVDFEPSINTYYKVVRIMDNSITTIEEFKQWLSENPIEVEYELATPIEHNLNYETLTLFDDTNNISFNDDLITEDDYLFVEDKITIDDYYETEKQPELYGPVNKVLLGMSTIDGENAYKAKLVDEIESISIDGKSHQETSTQGKNMLDLTKLPISGSTSVITISDLEPNKITMFTPNGALSWQNLKFDITPLLKPNTTYTINYKVASDSGKPNDGSDNRYTIFGMHKINKETSATTKVLECPSYNTTNYANGQFTTADDLDTENYYLRLWGSLSQDLTADVTLKLEDLYLAEETSFSGYVDFTPNSPSPEYHSEIKNVEGVTNLFDKDNVSLNKQWLGSDLIDSDTVNASPKIPVISGKQYKRNLGYTTNYFIKNDGSVVDIQGGTNTIVAPENSKYWVFNIPKEVDINTIMVVQGDTIPNYVPYGRWLEQKTIGKNMLDLSSFKGTTANGVTLIPKGNNTFTLKGTSTGHSNHAIDYKIPQEWLGKTLTLSVNENFKGNVGFKGKNISGDIFVVNTEKSKSKSLTITQEIIDKIYVFDIYANLSFTEEVTFTIQLEEDTATSHEPYKENTALVDLNIYDEEGNITGHYELCAIGDIKDTFKDGVLTQRIGKVVLDGSESGWSKDTTKTNTQVFELSNLTYISENSNLICDYFMKDVEGDSEKIAFVGSTKRIYIAINKSTASDLTTFKTWLSNNPVTVYYVLATPIEHTLNYEILELHEGYNNITTNDELEPNMIIDVSNIDNNVTTYSGNTITAVLSDNEETSLQIWDNPLTYTEDLRKIALNGSESLFGVRYTPMTTQTVGHPWLEASDYVKLTNLSNQTLYTYPLDRKLSYKGYIKSDISSKAPTLVQQQYEFNGDTDTKLTKTQISVDKANQRITAVASDMSDTNEKVSQLTITTGEIKTEVSQKATKIELNDTKTELNNNINTAKNDAITTANTNTDNKLKNYSTTTEMNSAITQKADSILSTVSTTYTTKEESANDIANAVNNINVGGRNYILNGSGKEKKGFFTNFSSIDEDGYCVHTLSSKNTYTSVSIAPGILLKCRDYKTGSKVTWSYDIMYTNWNFPEGTDRREFWMGQRYGSPSWVGVTQHNLPVVGQNGCELNKWFHVEKTVTIPAQAAEGVGTQEGAIQFYNSNADINASVTFKLRNVKLEYGNKATDWTPAPEDVDNKFKNYSTTTEMNSAIDQKADSITSTVSATYITKTDSANNIKNAINDIEIGGTNLWTGTKDFSTDAWLNMTHWLDSDEVYKGFAVKQRTGAWQGLSQDIEFNVGDVITFSGYVKKTAGAVFVYTGYGTGKTDKDGVAMNVANNDEWTYFNATFKVTTAGTIRCRVENNTSDATIYVCGLKLEKGNKATDWTPALTDQDAEVIELKQKVTTLEQTSSGFNITIGELSQFKTDTKSALEGINSDIKDVNTELDKKQSAEDVSKAMEARLEEGVGKVITKTGYSFTQDGLVVSKTGSEMSTVIDEDGMTINRSGNEVLVANHDGVVAYNLHANTYLLVGTNSRFENYTNNNGEARTGCFWIG